MTPPRWSEVEGILQTALELPESEQDAWIARECEGRPEVRREVESLLRAHRAAETFLEPHPHTLEGRRIGPYLLVEEIGAGGMGAVYRARREDETFKQQVAVKLMRASLEIRPEAVRRFLEERQILAGLAHPNIARLLDGGYTSEGTPYIVMEYVAGTPITDYCARNELDLNARLRLFLQLATGVEFAHQRLVIHRDIKPANVLVTGEGTPKLLDFGIAKLLDPEAAGADTTVRPLTPDYASPEQVRGRAMSTVSDVYSLGVLLYELVAGRRPYKLADTPLDQAIETICVTDPAPPSTVSQDVPEDLDAIVMKALRKEPESRYASVREFAEDIDRYLGFRPVLARQGTYRYVARKFVRRHRAGAATAAAASIFLAASAALVIRESQVARFERDRAQRRFNEVRRLAHSVIFRLAGQDRCPAGIHARAERANRQRHRIRRSAGEGGRGRPGIAAGAGRGLHADRRNAGRRKRESGRPEGGPGEFSKGGADRASFSGSPAFLRRARIASRGAARHWPGLQRRPMTVPGRKPTGKKLSRWPGSLAKTISRQ